MLRQEMHRMNQLILKLQQSSKQVKVERQRLDKEKERFEQDKIALAEVK